MSRRSQHLHREPGAREVGGGRQAVVAGADDHRVERGLTARPAPRGAATLAGAHRAVHVARPHLGDLGAGPVQRADRRAQRLAVVGPGARSACGSRSSRARTPPRPTAARCSAPAWRRASPNRRAKQSTTARRRSSAREPAELARARRPSRKPEQHARRAVGRRVVEGELHRARRRWWPGRSDRRRARTARRRRPCTCATVPSGMRWVSWSR